VIQANVDDILAANGDITLTLESGTVSGMFAWKAMPERSSCR
jgi:hypothetical protein